MLLHLLYQTLFTHLNTLFMKQTLIEQAVKDWANQQVTIKEVMRHVITWQDIVFALNIARNINYQLVDSLVSELIQDTAFIQP